MRKLILILFTVVSMYSCHTKAQNQQTKNYLPKNIKHEVVQDLSDLFTSLEEKTLSNKIIEFEKSTTNEIAILTVDSISPYKAIQKYGTDVARFWGIGKKETNNGLLIVLCKPCRKVSICTGLGTQNIITDSICKNLIDNTLIPAFKSSQYFNGINKTLDSLINKWR